LCEQLAESCRARLENQGVVLVTEIEPEVTLTGDAMVIELAVANLIENAAGFSPDGGDVKLILTQELGEVSDTRDVHKTRKMRETHNVVICVEDAGPGVPDYAKERTFDRFYSLPRPGSPHKGTGLGLPLVMEAAKLHGGTAMLENIPTGGGGGGCRATLILKKD